MVQVLMSLGNSELRLCGGSIIIQALDLSELAI